MAKKKNNTERWGDDFDKHDSEVARVPQADALLDDITARLGWTEGAGLTRGHWFAYEPGHQCLWSCKWVAYDRIIQPQDFMPVESMRVAEMLAELHDLAYLGDPIRSREAAQVLLSYYWGDYGGAASRWLQLARDAIFNGRQLAPEFTAPWDPAQPGGPVRLMTIRKRPRWPEPQAIDRPHYVEEQPAGGPLLAGNKFVGGDKPRRMITKIDGQPIYADEVQ